MINFICFSRNAFSSIHFGAPKEILSTSTFTIWSLIVHCQAPVTDPTPLHHLGNFVLGWLLHVPVIMAGHLHTREDGKMLMCQRSGTSISFFSRSPGVPQTFSTGIFTALSAAIMSAIRRKRQDYSPHEMQGIGIVFAAMPDDRNRFH